MSAVFARFIERAWYRPNWAGYLLLVLVAPLSLLYFLVVSLRSWLYAKGLLKAVQVSVPVVVVGNITTGGTGKTPVVIWLARQLQAQGYAPGIVSRGYGGVRSQDVMQVDAGSSPAEVGDEPFLIARSTGFPVQVGADRVAAIEALLARAPVNVIVSDDGLQHYRMNRDVELAVLDASRGLGNGWLLPAGPLREAASRLGTVDAVLWNGQAALALKEHCAGPAFDLVPGPAVNLKTGEHKALRDFSGQAVRALAGIGNPQRFYGLLQRYDITPVPVTAVDHGVVDLPRLLTEGGTLLMTEKDAVKYLEVADASCWYVPVRAVFEPEAEQQLMHTICGKLESAVSA